MKRPCKPDHAFGVKAFCKVDQRGLGSVVLSGVFPSRFLLCCWFIDRHERQG